MTAEKITVEEALETINRLGISARGYMNLKEAIDIAISALEKQIPKIRYNPDDEQNGHFYMVNGYMTCRKTGKDIRYPLISFEDLDYCPRCGQALVCSEVKK